MQQLQNTSGDSEHFRSEQIVLTTPRGLALVNVFDIVYCQSEGFFTTFFMLDNGQHIVEHTMKECYTMLLDYGFIKVNQRCIVNRLHVKRIIKKERKMELSQQQVLIISRYFMNDILRQWKIL